MNRRVVIHTSGLSLMAAGLLPRLAKAEEVESGAVGDGATDDLAALQDAIDGSAIDGDVLTLPEGEFLLSGTLFVDGKSDFTIRGAGAGRTTLRIDGEAGSPVVWVGGVEPVTRVILADLTFASDVSPEEATFAGEIGALVGDVEILVFQDVEFVGPDGTQYATIQGRVEITFEP